MNNLKVYKIVNTDEFGNKKVIVCYSVTPPVVSKLSDTLSGLSTPYVWIDENTKSLKFK